MIDLGAIEAGCDVTKILGPDNARTLLRVLELPDDERLAFVGRMYQRDDGPRSPRSWPTSRRT